MSEEETVALANAAKKGQLMSTKSIEWHRQQDKLNGLLDAAFATERQRKLQDAAVNTATDVGEIKKNLEKKRLR